MPLKIGNKENRKAEVRMLTDDDDDVNMPWTAEGGRERNSVQVPELKDDDEDASMPLKEKGRKKRAAQFNSRWVMSWLLTARKSACPCRCV